MLRLEHVTVEYDGDPAVVDADLELPDGQVLAVLGPSGCGKSTLLRAIAGLEPLTTGRILIGDRDVSHVPTHRRGFALMFQDGQLFAHLTVARNVGYALKLRQVPAARSRARIEELLGLVGLEGYGDRLPATLSGGERQRVALARALAVEPRVLLLDEPLSALDAGLRERLALDLREILRTAGTTTVFVTHDHEEAFAVADRMAVMQDGRIVQDGPVADVWGHPVDAGTALFLGYAQVLHGPAAARVLAAAGLPVAPAGDPGGPAVAVRRSALSLAPDGPIEGVVESARATPDQLRLVVDSSELGRVDAVARLGSRAGPGDIVRLAVDPGRVAVLR